MDDDLDYSTLVKNKLFVVEKPPIRQSDCSSHYHHDASTLYRCTTTSD